ncbi:MAG: hypothetical protein IT462_04195 [Planctomycetes bacterium]|nr:hypothetical protein [Planctomycetota bacterium]
MSDALLELDELRANALGFGEASLAKFESEIASALTRITTFPQSAPLVHRAVRRLTFPRTGAAVFYRVDQAAVVVVLATDSRRDPDVIAALLSTRK